MARNICKIILYIEFESDCWVGLDPALGYGKNLKNIFPVSVIFPGKFASITLLGFECTVNLKKLSISLEPILRKYKFYNFFLYELPLILRVGRKQK